MRTVKKVKHRSHADRTLFCRTAHTLAAPSERHNHSASLRGREVCAQTVDAVRHTELCVVRAARFGAKELVEEALKGTVLWELFSRQGRQALPSAETGGLSRASHTLGPSRLTGRNSM